MSVLGAGPAAGPAVFNDFIDVFASVPIARRIAWWKPALAAVTQPDLFAGTPR